MRPSGPLPIRQKLAAWSELLRLPNLLTVPGDPAAGFVLAADAGADAWRLIPAAGAAVLLYAMGLIQNDLLDFEQDARLRPERPLPSGRIAPGRSALAGMILGSLGVLLAFATCRAMALYVAVVLMLTITMYNRFARRVPLAGPLTMGLCRGLSLLLGAAAAGGLQSLAQPFVLSAAGTLLIYIAAVTALAEREENPAGAARLSLLPPPAMLAGLATFYAFTRPWALLGAGHPAWLLSLAAGSAAVLSVAIWGVRVALDPCKARPAVGRMIWALLPLQAAFIAAGQPTGWTLAVAVLCLWPAVWLLPQRSIRS